MRGAKKFVSKKEEKNLMNRFVTKQMLESCGSRYEVKRRKVKYFRNASRSIIDSIVPFS